MMHILGHLIFVLAILSLFFGMFVKTIKRHENTDIFKQSTFNFFEEINIDEYWKDLRVRNDYDKIMIIENGKLKDIPENKEKGSEIL
ncbi:MAG: hypothetical protein M0R03_03695 [Novosphingobium sp.]|jgi:hypothetical protein|nr:hypothetical protein [Novosphingobium sp.]